MCASLSIGNQLNGFRAYKMNQRRAVRNGSNGIPTRVTSSRRLGWPTMRTRCPRPATRASTESIGGTLPLPSMVTNSTSHVAHEAHPLMIMRHNILMCSLICMMEKHRC